MSLNARMSQGDPRLYSPNRDVAHNFDYVIKAVAERCEKGSWDALVDLAREKGVTDEELGRACQALCLFVVSQTDVKKESMASCLARCGFLDLSPAARIIVSAYLGTVILGMHWAGVREATLDGTGPVQTYQDLRDFGVHFASIMNMPRWKRRLHTFWWRLRRAWSAFTEAQNYG